eukprot:COSAG06_NODE_12503_length_1373_cov_0.959969_1_plen_53_part_10
MHASHSHTHCTRACLRLRSHSRAPVVTELQQRVATVMEPEAAALSNKSVLRQR